MKNRSILSLFLLLFLVVGCSRPSPEAPTPTPKPTNTLPVPPAKTTSTPDPAAAARAYLDAWKAGDIPAMYGMLTSVSRDAIDLDAFSARYQHVTVEAALKGIEYEIRSALTANPYSAKVGYMVTLQSALVGDIQADTAMNLSLEGGGWRVQWDDSLILPQLAGGNRLSMEYQIPTRANIYDRNNKALVAQSDAVAVRLDTGAVDMDQVDGLVSTITRMSGGQIQPERLRFNIENYRNSGGWGLAVGDFALDVFAPYNSTLSSYSGVILQNFRTRYYFDGGLYSVAAHVTGYRSLIHADEVDFYKQLGYRQDEWVGRAGLELWGEQSLGGKRGGALYVVSADNKIVTKLAESSPGPSQAIYTTLDKDFQKRVQEAIGVFPSDFRGGAAAVVLERDTGRVLAMASYPSFNPNLFEPTNINQVDLINTIFDAERIPTLNRATQGMYPLGSVFKIITMAAALESGKYTPEVEYNCKYEFTEVEGSIVYDWTWEHYREDGKTQPSGILTLPEGLMRSCNPWFWHIGVGLYNQGLTKAVSDMARGFGLGSLTGIELEENAGNIPDPVSVTDARNLAIGQGDTQVTPLQVASFVAAVGNGGTLYQPTVIDRIAPPDGEPTYVFTPTVKSRLPVSPENLKVIQDAMVSVVENRRGTAWDRFTGLSVSVAGKTGTAESGSGEPHAWFAGYTFQNNPDKPDIAVVVLVENIGEGSEIAAPIFRRIIESYYFGKPLRLYEWESQIGVVATEEPEETETPEPEESPTPEP
jgi:penicillin-binding protein 2